jgi:GR25 family glycosyltransferase involved in LPS biosynthesis
MALRKISVAHQSNAEETFIVNNKEHKQSPYSFFDDIVCINLKERIERREGTQKVWKDIGVDGRFHTVDRHPQGGMYGCFDSHVSVIRNAYEQGLNNVLIFEDDIKLSPSYSHQQVLDCIDYIKANDGKWDIFYFGYFPFDSNRGSLAGLFNAKFETKRIIGFAPLGTHALCLSRSGMKKVLDTYADHIGKTHYDMYLISLKLKSYCVVPCLFDQRLCLETDNKPLDAFEAMTRKFQCVAEHTNLMYKPTLLKYNINKYKQECSKKIVVMTIVFFILMSLMVALYMKS